MSSIQRFMTRSSLSRMRTLSRQATSSLKQKVSLLVFHQAQHLKQPRYFQRDQRTRARLSLHFSLIQVRDIFQQHFSRANFSNIQNRKGRQSGKLTCDPMNKLSSIKSDIKSRRAYSFYAVCPAAFIKATPQKDCAVLP